MKKQKGKLFYMHFLNHITEPIHFLEKFFRLLLHTCRNNNSEIVYIYLMFIINLRVLPFCEHLFSRLCEEATVQRLQLKTRAVKITNISH